jgi:hypothetical protein
MAETASLELTDIEIELRTKITNSLASINTKTRKITLAKKLEKFDKTDYNIDEKEQLFKDFFNLKRAIKTISNNIVKYESLNNVDTEFSGKQRIRLASFNSDLDIIYSEKTE